MILVRSSCCFLFSRFVTSYFSIVLFEQFEGATEFGSLLRANTPASRMLTTYTRRGPGQAYLNAILDGFVKHICAGKQIDLEINTQKVVFSYF